jgi:hypothetical protein
MKVQVFFLVVALIFLLPPMPLKAGVCKSSSRRSSLSKPLYAALVWQNWADLVRAALGVSILTRLAISADPAIPGGELRVLVCIGTLLGIGILLQTVRLGAHIQMIAPLFYMCGLTLALPGYAQGAFAVGVGWLFAVGGKNLEYQMPAMALALFAAGIALGRTSYPLLNCALILLPLVIPPLFLKRTHYAVYMPAETRAIAPVKQTPVR